MLRVVARGAFIFIFIFMLFYLFLNHLFIVSMVQEITCIFNDMAKTKPKIKHNLQQKKTNLTSSPNVTNKCGKAGVAKIRKV